MDPEGEEGTKERERPLITMGFGAFLVVLAYERHRHLTRHANELDPSIPLDAQVIFLYRMIGWPVMGIIGLVGLFLIIKGFRILRRQRNH